MHNLARLKPKADQESRTVRPAVPPGALRPQVSRHRVGACHHGPTQQVLRASPPRACAPPRRPTAGLLRCGSRRGACEARAIVALSGGVAAPKRRERPRTAPAPVGSGRGGVPANLVQRGGERVKAPVVFPAVRERAPRRHSAQLLLPGRRRRGGGPVGGMLQAWGQLQGEQRAAAEQLVGVGGRHVASARTRRGAVILAVAVAVALGGELEAAAVEPVLLPGRDVEEEVERRAVREGHDRSRRPVRSFVSCQSQTSERICQLKVV